MPLFHVLPRAPHGEQITAADENAAVLAVAKAKGWGAGKYYAVRGGAVSAVEVELTTDYRVKTP